MSKTLEQIAEQLKEANKKVQLIYAFNGTGKTRLSRVFKELITSKVYTVEGDDDYDPSDPQHKRILYYSAFTEDLFYWDNDLNFDDEPTLKIQPNSFTNWILKDQGQDQNIIANFQRYTNDKLTPSFHTGRKLLHGSGGKVTVQELDTFSDVTFSLKRGDDTTSANIKISKGEESNFIWSIFYTLLEQVIGILNVTELSDRDTNQFNNLEYIFIDDSVSSLDENHLIQLAVDVAGLIKSSSSELKFIVTTHNPLFYNVLCNELKRDDKNLSYKAKKVFQNYRLEKKEDGLFQLETQRGDSPFSYHLYLLSELKKAIESGAQKKYHFNFLRHVLEKTSTFLGHEDWKNLLPKTNDPKANPYEARIINVSSHSKHSGEEVADLTEDDKRVLGYLVSDLIQKYNSFSGR